MCTLCLSDMGELRDEWLREPSPPPATVARTLPVVAPRTLPPAMLLMAKGRLPLVPSIDRSAVAA